MHVPGRRAVTAPRNARGRGLHCPGRRGIDRSARREVLAASATAFAPYRYRAPRPTWAGRLRRQRALWGRSIWREARDRSGGTKYSCSLPTRLQGFDNATTLADAVQRPDRVSESECCRAMHLSLTTSKMHKAGLLNLKCTVSDPSLFDKCL